MGSWSRVELELFRNSWSVELEVLWALGCDLGFAVSDGELWESPRYRDKKILGPHSYVKSCM